MDPRIARTRGLLQEALLTLAREKDLDAISIADITERATVNRSTFYQHYPDKETLLADALDTRVQLAGADLDQLLPIDVTQEAPQVLVRYLEHLAENAALYRQALGEHGSPLTLARLRRRFSTIVASGICAHGFHSDDPTLPMEIAAAGITGSLIGVLTAWLEMDPLPPPGQAAQWTWLLIVPPKTH